MTLHTDRNPPRRQLRDALPNIASLHKRAESDFAAFREAMEGKATDWPRTTRPDANQSNAAHNEFQWFGHYFAHANDTVKRGLDQKADTEKNDLFKLSIERLGNTEAEFIGLRTRIQHERDEGTMTPHDASRALGLLRHLKSDTNQLIRGLKANLGVETSKGIAG